MKWKNLLEKFLDKKFLENSREIETDYKEERLIKIEHEIENARLMGYYYELEKYSENSDIPITQIFRLKLIGNIGNNFVKIFWDILDSDGLEIEIVKDIEKEKIWKEIKNKNFRGNINPENILGKL